MSEYMFRFPASTPELTFAGLDAYLSSRESRKIGTTVTAWRDGQEPRRLIVLTLYELNLAELSPNFAAFTDEDDPHQATTEWLGRIVRDNKIGSAVIRVPRRVMDGPGPGVARGQAGLLCIDQNRDKPVFGRVYYVRL